MTAYYNENDPAAAYVLRALIYGNVIALGEVDDRSITEVTPNDVRGFTQCHFFAGGGLWSVAARLAGWPDDRPLWTGSPPCQPFSVAGKGKGTDDSRHLWPHFHRLISQARPPIVVGEQVSKRAGLDWLDGVCDDLEAEGYTPGAASVAACAVDSPQIRERLWWWGALGDAESRIGSVSAGREDGRGLPESGGPDGPEQTACGCEMGNLQQQGLEGFAGHGTHAGHPEQGRSTASPDGTSYWGSHWIECYDGKYRRTEPGIRFLVNGISIPLAERDAARFAALDQEIEEGCLVGRKNRIPAWQIAGNAICPVLGAEVLRALL